MHEETTPTPAGQPDWWRLGPGLVLALIPALVAVTSWDAIRFSHPAYAVLLAVTAALGAMLIGLGLRRSGSRDGRRGVIARVLLVLVTALLGGVVWSLRPASATDLAAAAMKDGADVVVDQSATRIEMQPVGEARTTALIFYPGGLVEPRAYANILRPVAAAGYSVTIIKPPLGLAVFAPGAAADVAQPGDVVAGHSLGGVVAAAAVDDLAFSALALWASFPTESLAERTDLDATSIFGTEDGLTTVAQIAESRADLPPTTDFVEVIGAVHSHFGDYGDQRGDGTPTISRAEAQAQIVAATLALLDQVDADVSR